MQKGPVLRVVRAESTPSGSVGILLIDGLIHCWTLEPDPTDKHFYIPNGEYAYQRFHSIKHPNTFEVKVPGHTALLFHSGNTEDETEGCLLLGHRIDIYQGRRVIRGGTSRQAFEEFIGKMGDTVMGRITFESV